MLKIFILYFFFKSFYQFLSKEIELKEINFASEITLTIKGTGNQSILSDINTQMYWANTQFNYMPPYEILVNGFRQNIIDKMVYNLEEETNNITMKFDIEITDCSAMFNGLSNITFIDLSKFEMTKLSKMRGMFYNCVSLTSIIFGNFNTSLVTDMAALFYNCKSLNYLDLSNFDVSKVNNFAQMFHGCNSLISINFGNFNSLSANSMVEMFKECISLTSLDLSNFNTSLITDMNSMFYNCISLKSINLKKFITIKLTNMSAMFHNCTSLISLNLSNFNTSSVNLMTYMLKDCKSLKFVDLKSFNTSKVTKMDYFFYNCESLISLNLKSFDISSVTEIQNMFDGCKSLKFLDLNNFYPKKAIYMYNMFYRCSSLISINLNNFDISSVTNTGNMFNGCTSLISLDLRSFNINSSSIIIYQDMFYGCNYQLRYCYNEESMPTEIKGQLSNFQNFNCSDDCFTNSINKFIIEERRCIDDCSKHDIYKFEYDNICYKSCPNGTHNSSINEYICEDDLICENYYNYNYTACIDDIPEGYYLNDTTHKTIDKCNIKCKNCSLESEENNLCISCNTNDNYFPKFNDSSNNNSFINCYNKSFDGYYLDVDDKIYKLCYFTCKKCNTLGDVNNHQCIECNDDYSLIDTNCNNLYEYNLTDTITDTNILTNKMTDIITNTIINTDTITDTNIITNSIIYTSIITNIRTYSNVITDIITDTNIIKDTITNTNVITDTITDTNIITNLIIDTTNTMTDKITETNIITDTIIDTTNIMSDKITETNIITDTIIDTNIINEYSEIITSSESFFDNLNNNITNNIKNNFINEFILENKFSNSTIYYYEITSNMEHLRDIYKNITFIEFPPETNNLLIKYFNLDEKDKIFVLIIENLFKDLNWVTNNFDYKLFLENGTELNLTYIKEDFFANIYCPIIDFILANFEYCIYFKKQGYDIYNKKGNFYNDICSPAYLEKNDIIISDRKKDIYPNNATLCKENCEYKEVIIEEKRIICECNLNTNNNNSIKENDDFLIKEDNGNFFSYLLDKMNYKIFKCYKLLLLFDKIKQSYTFYAMLIMFFIIIFSNIIFLISGLTNIRKLMIKEFPTMIKVKKDTIKELKRIKKDNKNILFTSSKKLKKRKSAEKRRTGIIKRKLSKKQSNSLISSSKSNMLISNLKIKEINEDIKEKEDINELPFTQAVRKDKRNFFAIFFSIIFQKLELINLIFGDHKIKIVLIYQYILSLIIDFFFNTFLYSDEVVSNKYHNNGKLDLVVTISLSLASNIITSLLCNFLNFSKGVEERLEQIMDIKKEFSYLYALKKFIKILKIRIFLYFIIELIFNSFSFYYIIIFCIVYNNTQISLLTNYLMSLLESFITAIIISIIVVITRKIGIDFINNNFYNTSKYIMQYF